MGAWIFFRLGQRLVDAERAEHRTIWKFKDYVHERPRPEFVPLEPELERIDRAGQAILRVIATPISAGYLPHEVANSLGISTSSVSKLLRELRDELGAQ